MYNVLRAHLHSKASQENGDGHELRPEVAVGVGLLFLLFVVAPVRQRSGASDAFVLRSVETAAAGVSEREQAGGHRLPESKTSQSCFENKN